MLCFVYRSYANCSPPRPWQDDKIKAYSLCPWFANTDLVKDISELEKKTMFRVLTIEDVGNAFDQVLDADEYGGVFVVFPDVPVIKYPELNRLFIIPVIAYAKLIALCRPEWKRINGIYAMPLLLLIIIFILYVLFCIIF